MAKEALSTSDGDRQSLAPLGLTSCASCDWIRSCTSLTCFSFPNVLPLQWKMKRVKNKQCKASEEQKVCTKTSCFADFLFASLPE